MAKKRGVDPAPVSRWQPGETVVLRYFKRGRPVGALPTRVVSSDGLALWLSPGTTVTWPAIGGRPVREIPIEERYRQPWRTTDRLWEGDGVLILGRPERAHSVWLFRDGGDFAGWYVNLEEPWRPCRVGFDTADHELDLWIDRDGSWRWKDEQELDALVKQGHFSPEQAAKIRAEGERVIAEWPFPTGWEDWRADPSWPVPRVPGDWQA